MGAWKTCAPFLLPARPKRRADIAVRRGVIAVPENNQGEVFVTKIAPGCDLGRLSRERQALAA